MGWRNQFLVLGFAAADGKARHSKKLTGAFQIDGAACTLSVDREVKSGIPASSIVIKFFLQWRWKS
jgi:hypothetical protein